MSKMMKGKENTMDLNQFDENGRLRSKKGNRKPSKKKGRKSVDQGNEVGMSKSSVDQGIEKPSKEGTSRQSDGPECSDEDLDEKVLSYADLRWCMSHTDECFACPKNVPVVMSFAPPFSLRELVYEEEDPFIVEDDYPTTGTVSESLEERIKRISLASSDSEPEEGGMRRRRL